MGESFDVIVFGGGPAGACAAIQSARAGARTLLVERSGILGGTTTLNGVNYPGLFHAWGRQVIAGIGWELVCESVRESGGSLPDFANWEGPHWKLQVRVDRAHYAHAIDRAVADSGCALLMHAMPAAVEHDEARRRWRASVCCKEGLREFDARVLVDCTGDADVVGMAGLKRHRNETLQPATLIFRLGGYVLDALDLPALERAWADAVARGEVHAHDMGTTDRPVSRFLACAGDNVMHVPGIDGSTSAGRTEAELRGRAGMIRTVQFLRGQPGLASLRIEHFATECGVRETFTIDAELRISGADYCEGKVWPDSVCHSFYPIDIHERDRIDIRPLSFGTVPTIPLRAMLARSADGLLAAGRCIGGDKLAQSAYRVQASCMAMGQAAGAAAALAGQREVDIRDVPFDDLRRLLEAHGAIVPDRASDEVTADSAQR